MDDDSLQKVIEHLEVLAKMGRALGGEGYRTAGEFQTIALRLSALRERLLKETQAMTLDSTGGPLVTAAILRSIAGGQPE